MSCQRCESSAWSRGLFGALHRPEAVCLRAFGVSGERGAKGEGRRAEPDRIVCRFEIRLFGVNRKPAPVPGLVLALMAVLPASCSSALCRPMGPRRAAGKRSDEEIRSVSRLRGRSIVASEAAGSR